ncbi:MAG: helix-hairpin-helix domain-containing protein [Pleurocapsa minor GSE-CHR-MK-17-07R]|jgi:competence protein ComEA|nr:helix-hairpin-helix domain-containing protein [Pleurocapsa minor GSE-CHR-MK 17-07R]
MPTKPSRIFPFVIGLLSFALVLLAAGLIVTRPQPVALTIIPPEPSITPLPPTPSPTPGPLTVYVTGRVAQPGMLVEVPRGARVDDVLTAAGGALADADLSLVNLAGIVRDGDQIHVPARGETVTLPTPADNGIVYVNSASAEELDALPGIGPALAQAIIAYREANGPFMALEDLDAVEGIGEALMARLAEFISFE